MRFLIKYSVIFIGLFLLYSCSEDASKIVQTDELESKLNDGYIYYNPDLHQNAKYIQFNNKRSLLTAKDTQLSSDVELLPLPPVPLVDSFVTPFYADARHDSDFFCVFSDSILPSSLFFEATELRCNYTKNYTIIVNDEYYLPGETYTYTIDINVTITNSDHLIEFKKIEKFSNNSSEKITYGFIDLEKKYAGIIIKHDDSAINLWFNKMLDIYKVKQYIPSQIGRSDCSQRYLFPVSNIYAKSGNDVFWNDRYITETMASSATMFLYEGYISPEEIEEITTKFTTTSDFTFPESVQEKIANDQLKVIYNYTLPGYYQSSYRCGWEYNLSYLKKKVDIPCFVVFVPATTSSENVNFNYWQGEIIPNGIIDLSSFAYDGQIECNTVSLEIEEQLINGVNN
jgi:hypothetical protein